MLTYGVVPYQTHQDDQWAYIVEQFPTEKAVRWRYDMTEREFFSDDVEVKIDEKVILYMNIYSNLFAVEGC